MAGADPSYYQSGVCQDIRQKEHRFHLYIIEKVEGTPDANQRIIIRPPSSFGTTVVNDWTISDGPADNANIVARARGMHMGDSKDDESMFVFHSILFTDSRFNGSSLKVFGDFTAEKDCQWAIIGGTGEFAYAQGVVNAKTFQSFGTGRIWELHIRAFCLCISERIKMGPWGGVRGTAFDVPEIPLSLQTVTIGYGDVINSIAFSYTGQDGQTKTAGPWGGDGLLTTKITLVPSETIKQVTGITGTVEGDEVITSFTLVSNLRTYGPFGISNGTPFNNKVPDGKSVVGFYGRAGASVNALGIYYA